MAGLTQKSCAALFPFWSGKKTFYFLFFVFLFFGFFWQEQMRVNRNIKNFKLKFYKKSCHYDDNCNKNYYFSDNKDKK